MKTSDFILLLAIFREALCQSSSGKILSIGVGTFIIIIAIIFSVVWCFACRNSSKP